MSKLGIHYDGRGIDAFLLDAGMRIAKFVNNPPPPDLPSGTWVFRWVENPDNINGEIDAGHDPDERAQWWIDKQSPHFIDVPKFAYIEGPNENRCRTAADARWLNAFEMGRMKLMEARGYHCCIFNFGTGIPSIPLHDADGVEIWTELLPAMRYAMANGHLFGQHAYEEDAHDIWNFLRYRQYYSWLPADARPNLFIGEWGREPAWRSANGCTDAAYLELIRAYDAEVMKDLYVAGFTLFTCGTGNSDAWKPFDIEGQPVMAMIANYLKSAPTLPPTPQPIPDPTPTPEPEPDENDEANMTTNLLTNGGFEGSVHEQAGISGVLPDGWEIAWADHNEPRLNPNAPEGQGHQSQDWVVPEIITRTPAFVTDIPVPEQITMLKVFHGNAPVWTTLAQTKDLPAGRFRFGGKFFPDMVVSYSPKVYPKVGDSPDWYLCSEIILYADGPKYFDTGWMDARVIPNGQWTGKYLEFDWPGGSCRVVVSMRGRWGYKNCGWWLDDFILGPVAVTTPPSADCSAVEAQLASVTTQRDLALTKLAQILDVING